MNERIILDIETEPKPLKELQAFMPEFTAPSNWKDEAKIAANIEEQKTKFVEKAALSPLTGLVNAIGIKVDGEHVLIEPHTMSEGAMLETMWKTITEADAYTRPVVGWNLLGFDLDFLIKRSWANRVRVPFSTLQWYKGRSYLNPQFIDLMRFFCISPDERYMKLDVACQLIGIEGKVDLDGELFYEAYKKNPAKALSYLKQDLDSVDELAHLVL